MLSINLLYAQSDTLSPKLLNEVTIQSAQNDRQFNFYQSSKLASTEEILSRMEGVNLIRRGPFGMEPTLRNYSANQINLSIDGMRIYGACTDKMDPVSVYVEPINLQGISAAQGAQGNFVGSSIGGNINLKFKAPQTLCHTQYLTQVIQSYQSNNQAVSTSFAFEKAGPNNGLRISGTYRKANNYSSPDSIIKYSAYEKLNVSVAYQHVLDSNNQIRFNYLGDWGKNMGYPALPMDVGKANASIFSLTHNYKNAKKNLGSETKVYYNSIYHSMDDTQRENIPMHMDMPSWSETKGFYNELSFKIKKHNFLTRLDGHENRLQADMTMYPSNGDPKMYMQTLPISYIKNLGFAAQYQLDIRANYYMKWNARLDYFSQKAREGIGSDQVSGMGYDISEVKQNYTKSLSWVHCYSHSFGLNQSLVLGYAERLPSSNERYGFYLFNPMDGYDYIGNPDLKTEKSWQVEWIVKQDYKKLNWSFHPFFHHNKDYIYTYVLADYYPMTIGARGAKSYQNISYANTMGAETTLGYRFTNWIQYRANFKYLYAQTNAGTPLPLVAPFKYQGALRISVWQTQFQLEQNYSAAQNRINTDFGERKTGSFNLVNIRASKSFTKNKNTFQLALSVENLFNINYHEHLDIGYIPRMGRNFGITLGYILR
ncbi:MAG: TonB-dependent receptor [Bacteroidia bacterium]|nr:TonB-dependent receptor [Bacteroidia bacterium]MCF8446312.1 TonB-dependent receptor [Bacteroidia bacterium]